jgi:hypothetical protein
MNALSQVIDTVWSECSQTRPEQIDDQAQKFFCALVKIHVQPVSDPKLYRAAFQLEATRLTSRIRVSYPAACVCSDNDGVHVCFRTEHERALAIRAGLKGSQIWRFCSNFVCGGQLPHYRSTRVRAYVMGVDPVQLGSADLSPIAKAWRAALDPFSVTPIEFAIERNPGKLMPSDCHYAFSFDVLEESEFDRFLEHCADLTYKNLHFVFDPIGLKIKRLCFSCKKNGHLKRDCRDNAFYVQFLMKRPMSLFQLSDIRTLLGSCLQNSFLGLNSNSDSKIPGFLVNLRFVDGQERAGLTLFWKKFGHLILIGAKPRVVRLSDLKDACRFCASFFQHAQYACPFSSYEYTDAPNDFDSYEKICVYMSQKNAKESAIEKKHSGLGARSDNAKLSATQHVGEEKKKEVFLGHIHTVVLSSSSSSMSSSASFALSPSFSALVSSTSSSPSLSSSSSSSSSFFSSSSSCSSSSSSSFSLSSPSSSSSSFSSSSSHSSFSSSSSHSSFSSSSFSSCSSSSSSSSTFSEDPVSSSFSLLSSSSSSSSSSSPLSSSVLLPSLPSPPPPSSTCPCCSPSTHLSSPHFSSSSSSSLHTPSFSSFSFSSSSSFPSFSVSSSSSAAAAAAATVSLSFSPSVPSIASLSDSPAELSSSSVSSFSSSSVPLTTFSTSSTSSSSSPSSTPLHGTLETFDDSQLSLSFSLTPCSHSSSNSASVMPCADETFVPSVHDSSSCPCSPPDSSGHRGTAGPPVSPILQPSAVTSGQNIRPLYSSRVGIATTMSPANHLRSRDRHPHQNTYIMHQNPTRSQPPSHSTR